MLRLHIEFDKNANSSYVSVLYTFRISLLSDKSAFAFFVRSFGCALFYFLEETMKENLRKLYNESCLAIVESTSNTNDKNSLLEDLDKCHHSIMDRLDDDGKAIFAKFERLHGELLVSEGEASFIRGFSLAAKLMSESLT